MLFNGLIQPNLNIFLNFFTIVYVPAFLVLISIFLLIFLIIFKLESHNSIKILLATTLTLIFFNIIDNTKHHNQIKFFEKQSIKKFENSKIILIFDEMSGMNSLASKSPEGKIVNQNFIKLFDKYNFNYYPNIFSISDNTVGSLSSLINFKTKLTEDNIKKFSSPSKNYFSEYNIKQNNLFDKHKSVSVIQNMHINFCNNSNVTKCYQYNPLNLEIINADIDPLSKIISSWSLNGSIVAKLIWRVFKQFGLITSILEPEGEKKFIKEIFNYTLNEINSKKYDLIFLHILVPHIPYGFNKKCEYNVKISNFNTYLNQEAKIKQHNIERNCLINFIDKFLNKIDFIDNHKIFIMSDHGSRIANVKNSSFTTIFAHKNVNSIIGNSLNEKNMHKEFKILNNE